jgi:uncharacterized membrane protein YdbT with pleckstrin-like domain
MTAQTSTSASDSGETTLFEGHPATVPGVGILALCLVTAGLALLYLWLRSRGITYKVTTRRVIVERGLLSKRLEQIDAYRIKDYVVERPFSQRLLGTGNITLITMDATTQNVELRDLPTDVVGLYEKLRAASEEDRVRRGVRILDSE